MAAALTLAMMFALVSPVFAEDDPPGKITINNPTTAISLADKTFSAYRIFELESFNPDTGNYAYTIDADFENFSYTPEGGGGPYVGNDIAGYLESIKGDSDLIAKINHFADAVYDEIDVKNIQPKKTADGTAASSVEISPLPLGYYLVYTDAFTVPGQGTGDQISLVSANILTTTDEEAKVTIKVGLPELEKKVYDEAYNPDTTDGNADDFGAYTDLNIGESAHFLLTSAVPNRNGYASYTYTVYDTLDSGLTYNDDVEVYVDGEKLVNDSITYYTVNAIGQQIKIEFDEDEFMEFSQGDSIAITYSATLNSNAVINDKTSNEAYIEYSNNPYEGGTGKTLPKEADVYTFEFDLYKYTGTFDPDNLDATALPGAEFELYTDDNDAAGTVIPLISLTNGRYRHLAAGENSGTSNYVTSFTSPDPDADGYNKINIGGLDAGTYWLREKVAPTGYNKIDDIKVKIDPTYEDGELVLKLSETSPSDNVYLIYTYVEGIDTGTKMISVKNNTGAELPESGGIGRTIFTIVGLLLMLGAGLVLVARRKTAAA
ncbi:MAG: isopeptide-forming domain-containing fimbrial protein, partial [Clostridiales Family XIII bacterium]|nr:isopeptide-forming domain-containing fimbrial protein [Clostridiales Family XIII bacterium]